MKAAYYDKWSQEKHIKVFGKMLNDEKTDLVGANITITDKYKLQFYIEHMYDSTMFDQEDITK